MFLLFKFTHFLNLSAPLLHKQHKRFPSNSAFCLRFIFIFLRISLAATAFPNLWRKSSGQNPLSYNHLEIKIILFFMCLKLSSYVMFPWKIPPASTAYGTTGFCSKNSGKHTDAEDIKENRSYL